MMKPETELNVESGKTGNGKWAVGLFLPFPLSTFKTHFPKVLSHDKSLTTI